jgi:NADH dehydrogenase FAD-containing subunit
MKDILPKVHHTTKNVAKIEADKKMIHTDDGETFTYNHLIVTSGLTYHWDKIKGAK